MKSLFDDVSFECSKKVTQFYSTSFSTAVKMLAPSIRKDIYNIYGFVRLADEIVDSFHEYDKKYLLGQFENELEYALENGISLNPILNSFIHTVKKYAISKNLINAFLSSMRKDLMKSTYSYEEEFKEYIYGSADVVGLMCLKVFVKGNNQMYEQLKEPAMKLGSAFQKVNFLRDLKDDYEILNRSYFPGIDLENIDQENMNSIIEEIEDDFRRAFSGILRLPNEAKFGVYTAYIYYKNLLRKLKSTHYSKILSKRIRISNPIKIGLLLRSFLAYKLNLIK